MSAPEGAKIEDLLRDLGEEPLRRELVAMGFEPIGNRYRCPFPLCSDKGPKSGRSVAFLRARGHPRIFCHRCSTYGDLIDLIQLSRGLTKAEAIAQLNGLPPPSKPVLRVVPDQAATTEDPDKISPTECRRLWEGLAQEDERSRQYLEKRGLGDAVDLGIVRFATETHPEKEVRRLGGRAYRVAALMKDVVGNPRGIQFRNVGTLKADQPKILSAKGSAPKSGFLGDPELIESSAVVAVAEGIADTLALAIWSDQRPGVAVVGGAGKGMIPRLAEELVSAGIPLEGKTFALFVQNDRPENKSRREFNRLAQKLRPLGAEVVFVSVPDEQCEDIAAWRALNPDTDWPPPELGRVLVPEPGDDTPRAAVSVLPTGNAIPIPTSIRADMFGQDFHTLCTILDDPSYREPVMGRGEIAWCQMRRAILFNGRPLADADLFAVRLGIERECKSTTNKPLKFAVADIEQALVLVAHKKLVHPVRDWLNTLKWDSVERLDELAPLMGHPRGSFAGTLLSRWMVSAVARAMEPGCKADCALVLEGNQETHKTTFLEALGGEWYTSESVTPGDKDGKLLMLDAWIIEWGELEGMRRARDIDAVKDFLSRRIDKFRPHYGRQLLKAPRACIIAGTTNNPQYLSDPTGNRRFWTVKVLQEIDLAWVRNNRDQLFAEALALFSGARACEACRPTMPDERCAKHRWWLTTDESNKLATSNKKHEWQDEWVNVIADWIGQQSKPMVPLEVVSVHELLEKAIGKPPGQWHPRDPNRVAEALRKLGWIRSSSRRYQGRIGRWWMSPGCQARFDPPLEGDDPGGVDQ